MTQDVFILGATGKVGTALIRQIFDKGDTNSEIHKNPTRIVGVASSSRYQYSKVGITREAIFHFLENSKIWGMPIDSLGGLVENCREQTVFVDVTAAKEVMFALHRYIIRLTKHSIVTANKMPLVIADAPSFRKLTSQVHRYGFRCSVMAGAEAVNKIRDLKDLGDEIQEISGCFSGTLGYITSELERGEKFSSIVVQAMARGFTEPHPAEDLGGNDVARKILILARTAGYNLDGASIKLAPLVSEKYLTEKNIELFTHNLGALDEYFRNKVAIAKQRNNVLRYVATLEMSDGKPEINVGLREVPRDSPLGALQGTRNKIVIKTKTYAPNFYSVEAPGAGLEITAQNIRRDLLDQIQNRIVNYSA